MNEEYHCSSTPVVTIRDNEQGGVCVENHPAIDEACAEAQWCPECGAFRAYEHGRGQFTDWHMPANRYKRPGEK